MKWMNSIAGAIRKGVYFLKVFQCISAGLNAFVDEAEKQGLLKADGFKTAEETTEGATK